MVNYLNRFDPTLTELAELLRRLYKHDVIVDLGSQQQTAFEMIKSVISSLPVLVYFNQGKNHVIQSDAFKKRLNAVLLQDGHPVIYALRSLTETEQQYFNKKKGTTRCCLCIQDTESLYIQIYHNSAV